MSKDLSNGRRLADCPAVLFDRDVYVGVLYSFQFIKVGEDVVNFCLGFNFNDYLFDLFGRLVGFSHEHNSDFIHESIKGFISVLIIFMIAICTNYTNSESRRDFIAEVV